jgi:hypothetical protein
MTGRWARPLCLEPAACSHQSRVPYRIHLCLESASASIVVVHGMVAGAREKEEAWITWAPHATYPLATTYIYLSNQLLISLSKKKYMHLSPQRPDIYYYPI